MKFLFVHNNFPGQYQNIVRALTENSRMQIAAIGASTARSMKGVNLLKYSLRDIDVSPTHPFARRFDLECHRAEQVLYALSSLATANFVPDVIMAHPGWGETLPLRSVFPKAHIILYCEFFYGLQGRDTGFDPEFAETGIDGDIALQLKNAASLLALADCDSAISPTNWQRSTFPTEYQHKIKTIHEGIDADVVKPSSSATFNLPSGRRLRCSDEIVTFVARNLEPLRGYHIFMRALPEIMAKRPNTQIVIVGGDGVSYGANPPDGKTWKSIFFDEVAGKIDKRRVHFVGGLPYAQYLNVLQISSAHVYLTYPFVLSWSLLEAMSAGCVVIASDTAPVREVINKKNGILVPFFDVEQLADSVVEILSHPERYHSLREDARQTIKKRYDLSHVCLPKMMAFIENCRMNSWTICPASAPVRQI